MTEALCLSVENGRCRYRGMLGKTLRWVPVLYQIQVLRTLRPSPQSILNTTWQYYTHNPSLSLMPIPRLFLLFLFEQRHTHTLSSGKQEKAHPSATRSFPVKILRGSPEEKRRALVSQSGSEAGQLGLGIALPVIFSSGLEISVSGRVNRSEKKKRKEKKKKKATSSVASLIS